MFKLLIIWIVVVFILIFFKFFLFSKKLWLFLNRLEENISKPFLIGFCDIFVKIILFFWFVNKVLYTFSYFLKTTIHWIIIH